eukprot:scaffold98321_cov19-Prasinocladus_malaysianus.AAC.1
MAPRYAMMRTFWTVQYATTITKMRAAYHDFLFSQLFLLAREEPPPLPLSELSLEHGSLDILCP